MLQQVPKQAQLRRTKRGNGPATPDPCHGDRPYSVCGPAGFSPRSRSGRCSPVAAK